MTPTTKGTIMKIDYRLVAGLLAIGYTWEIAAHAINLNRSKKAIKANGELATYLADKLDQNQIPLNEFDEIALNEIVNF